MNEHSFNLQDILGTSDSDYPAWNRRPVIGITANFMEDKATLAEAYYLSVIAAGGTPLLIPPYQEREALFETLEHVDAIILSGGADIDPRYMGEEPDYTLLHTINPKRDTQEILLTVLAERRGMPILGICRGIQMLAAALGGNVHQDIYAGIGGELLMHDQDPVERHKTTHSVDIVQGSLLARIFGTKELAVNTFHHQAVKSLPSGFMVNATATDGVIEGIETTDCRPIIGVQWHPESFIMDNNRCMLPIFQWVVDEAMLYRRTKELHGRITTIDSHCDTPMLFAEGYRLEGRSDKALVDLHKMREGMLDVVTMAAYIPQKGRDAESLAAAAEKATILLDGIEEQVARNSSHIQLCSTPQEVMQAKKAGKRAIMRAIENGYAIGTDLSLIRHFKERGVVYMTLCHNGDNDICDSARGNGEHGGLSAYGREVVKEMNRQGMMIDLSHAAESTFDDVLLASTQPVVCSHSSCRALCDHPRNLTDRQIKALADKGGVMQVTMYSGFLRKDGEAALDDFMLHLEHAISVAGIYHVGIGTDFDGDGKIIGCSSASQLSNITRELLRRGYSNENIGKIWGGNWLRVMKQVQESAQQ
ncbi:MAG: membrane dipeptidase [Bacteroidaceae bacterium]|nr:membrane dipeptidase [Bacteroidaceae bacterium]